MSVHTLVYQDVCVGQNMKEMLQSLMGDLHGNSVYIITVFSQ